MRRDGVIGIANWNQRFWFWRLAQTPAKRFVQGALPWMEFCRCSGMGATATIWTMARANQCYALSRRTLLDGNYFECIDTTDRPLQSIAALTHWIEIQYLLGARQIRSLVILIRRLGFMIDTINRVLKNWLMRFHTLQLFALFASTVDNMLRLSTLSTLFSYDNRFLDSNML